MGLSSLPAPSEGVLCVLLVNTALSLSIFKGLVRTILHIVGIEVCWRSAPATSASSDSEAMALESSEQSSYSYSYIEEFRSRIATIRFCDHNDTQSDLECSVCLTQFEADSEINHLTCGHVFHNLCLEKWFDYNYSNITCPLCRTPLMPEDDISCFW